MTSELDQFANAYIKVVSGDDIEVVNGRVTPSQETAYIIKCYLPRTRQSATSIGSGQPKFGGAGIAQEHTLRGYMLSYLTTTVDYDLSDGAPSGSWTPLTSTIPDWLSSNLSGVLLLGIQSPQNCVLNEVGGRYGGAGIDIIVIDSVGGIPVTVTTGGPLTT